MTSANFTVSELEVIRLLGVGREILSGFRGDEGDRWKKMANGRIMWSPAGIAAAEEEILKKSAVAPAAVAPPAKPLDARVELFVMVRARSARVLHVTRPGQAYDVRLPISVWLPQPKAQLFRPGMALLARFRNDLVWDFEGNPAAPEKGRRLPRRPGQW